MYFKTLTILSIIVISNYAMAQSDIIFKANFESIIKLNDTGITVAGNSLTGNSAECSSNSVPSPQDCNAGRDATQNDDSDGHAGFSYTKLDANGVPLADQSVDYQTEPWSCVKDNVSGLIWEVKTNDPGIHNLGNTYKWGGITPMGINHSSNRGDNGTNDWNVLVDGSNTEALCGLNNWRVPNANELFDLVNLSNGDLTIDTNYFPNTVSGIYWTSSPYAPLVGRGWTVLFANGGDTNRPQDNFYYVRLVSD